MTVQQSAHERLVEKVALEINGPSYSRDNLTPRCLEKAKRVIALIANETAEATTEMIEEYNKGELIPTGDSTTYAEQDWRAMHSASALWPETKTPPTL